MKPEPLVLALATLLSATVARAEEPSSHPQFNAGLLAGLAGAGSGGLWQQTKFHLGLRGDVLLGRHSPKDWGIGPVVNVSTNGFSDLNLGAGVTALAPVHEFLPIVLAVGPYVRRDEGWEPGGFASIFWGSRSFNYHSAYGMAGGLLVEARAGFGSTKERTVIVAAHLDLQVLALPVLLLINAFR